MSQIWHFEEEKLVLLYTPTHHSGSHVHSLQPPIEREKDSNVFLTIYTKKKNTDTSQVSSLQCLFVDTILITHSHSNFTHCHKTNPWWLVTKDVVVACVTRNITGFLNGIEKRGAKFRKPSLFPFWGNNSEEPSGNFLI